MAKFELGKSLAKTGDFIGNNKKPLLYVGGAIAVVIIGYAIVKRVKGAIKGEEAKGGKYNKQNVDRSKTSISEETASNYAEQLFRAFNYTIGTPPLGVFGTDKSVIDSVFSRINPEDFKMVYNAFGTRSYSTVGSPSNIDKFFNNFDNLDLISWLNEELGFGDSALKEKIRKVVEPAGFVLEK
jgi:hypothetical protein